MTTTPSDHAHRRPADGGAVGSGLPPAGPWLARAVARHRVTASVLGGLLFVGAAAGSLPGGPTPALLSLVGVGVGPWQAGRWWTLATAPWFGSGPVAYLVSAFAVVILLGSVERTLGPARTAMLAAVTQVLGTGVGMALVAMASALGDRWGTQLHDSIAVGPGPLVVGAALAASARWPVLWRRRARVVLLIGLVILALYSGLLPDLLRLGAGLTGLAIGALMWGRIGRGTYRPLTTSSRHESRVLVALIVAATAVGPMLAMLAANRLGPLAVLRFVFGSPRPDLAVVTQQCLNPDAPECVHLRALLRLSGPAPAVMSVMPALLLLIAAEGLRRGRRAAWIAAVALNLALTATGLLLATDALTEPAEQQLLLGTGVHVHAWLDVAIPAVQPLLVALLLLATRRWFPVCAEPALQCRWAWRVGVVAVVVSAVDLGGSLVVADQYRPRPGLGDLLLDLPLRFLPPGYLGETSPPFLPVGPVAALLFDGTGPAFWTVAVIAAFTTFARTPPPSADVDLTRMRRLLARTSGSSLAHMTTWPGHSYFFLTDWEAGADLAAIAYRVIGGVALTTGGPVGDPDRHLQAVDGFVGLCEQQAWTPCLYSVDSRLAEHLRSRGWSSVQVAEETVVPLAGLTFTGHKWQDVRTALNKAAKAGITARWTSWQHEPRSITDQIRVVSEEWVADKGLPELGFTLGGLDELADEDVRLMLAVDADGTVHGITSWLPVRRGGVTVGWTLDFMRRRGDGFRGVTEFLIATTARQAQAEGVEYLSLSGAPLARLDHQAPADLLQRLLDLIGRALEPVYGFRSLLAFKAKFQPRYHPLYMAYPDPAALPSIGTAITRAYLPGAGARDIARLVRHLGR